MTYLIKRNFVPIGIFAFFMGTAFFGEITSNWPFINSYTFSEIKFADLRSLLHLSDFLRDHPTGNYFDDKQADFEVLPNYPIAFPWLLANLHLGITQTHIIGYFFATGLALAFSFSWASIIRYYNFREIYIVLILGITLITSAPFLLVTERGNYDSVIFTLMALSILATYKSKYWIATILIVCMSVLKLFPVLLLFGIGVISRKFRYCLTGIFIFGFYTLNTFQDLILIKRNTPNPDFGGGFGQFSISHFVLTHSTNYSSFFELLSWLTIHSIGLIAVYYLFKGQKYYTNNLVSKMINNRKSLVFYCFGTLVTSTIYVLGNSWDYRLIFFIFPLIGFILATDKITSFDFLILSLYFIIFYFSFNSSYISVVGDLGMIVLIYVQIYVFAKLIIELFSTNATNPTMIFK